jgi:cytochrome P450 family 6
MSFGLQVTFSLVALVIFLLYKWFTKHFDYWKNHGVTFIKPVPVFGSVTSSFLIKEHIVDIAQRWYYQYEGKPYIGYYQGRTPALMVFDPELIARITVKDFSHFTDHGLRVSFLIIYALFITK